MTNEEVKKYFMEVTIDYSNGIKSGFKAEEVVKEVLNIIQENDELKLEISRLTRIHANYVKSDFHEYCEMREYNDDLIVRNGMLRSENEELKLTISKMETTTVNEDDLK
jgi:hypothetical protein